MNFKKVIWIRTVVSETPPADHLHLEQRLNITGRAMHFKLLMGKGNCVQMQFHKCKETFTSQSIFTRNSLQKKEKKIIFPLVACSSNTVDSSLNGD